MTGNLVYRCAAHDDAVTFAPLSEAVRVDGLHSALQSKTWGEFRAALGEEQFTALFEDTDPEDLPGNEEEFEADVVPGFSDGDFPPWLAPEMDRWIPLELLRQFGRRADTAVNGSFWEIAEERAEELAQALRARGFVVEKRKDLKFW